MSTNRKDEVMTGLLAGITNLTSSERWQEWLKVQSRFQHYSFNNSLLIGMQCPDATRVAGFHAWRRLGRNVRKGEKAIWILAPVTKKAEEAVTGNGDGALDQKGRVLVAFKPAAVFDLSQTDGEELPEVCSHLSGDDRAIFEALAGECARRSIRLTFDELGERNGYFSPDVVDGGENGSIVLNSRRSPAQWAKTLAHELAHSVLHRGGYAETPRPLAELEAESIAYIVCANLGLESGEYSFGYVATWAGGGDEAIAGIKAAGARIQRTADDILARLDNIEENVAA
jgi:antirestriction protein ArdC